MSLVVFYAGREAGLGIYCTDRVPLLHTPASSEGFNLTVTPDPQRQKEMKKLAGQEEGGT